MASTYSTDLRVELQTTGENTSTWGTKLNAALNKLEDGITATAAIVMADANRTLTASNGVADEASCAIINCTGALTANRNLTIPATSKNYVVINSTTGGFSLVVTNGTNSFTVINGATALIITNGSFVSGYALNLLSRTITGTSAEITVTNGSGATANPIISLPSALTFTSKTITGGTFDAVRTDGSFARATAGTLLLRPNGSASSTGQATIDTTGNFVSSANVSAYSDSRLKTNVEDIHDAERVVSALKPKKFHKMGVPGIGFIAQDIEHLIPEAIVYTKNDQFDELLSLVDMPIIAYLVSNQQQMMAKIAKLEDEIAALKQ